MYPQISVASLIKIKSERNKHWPEIYILKYHVLNLIFIPIQISYSSLTAILPEILIVAIRAIYEHSRKSPKKNTKIITFE